MNPSFTQNRAASRNGTPWVSTGLGSDTPRSLAVAQMNSEMEASFISSSAVAAPIGSSSPSIRSSA